MTDMTRAEIFRMGVVTQQLGIRDEQELTQIVRAGLTTRLYAWSAKRQINGILDRYFGTEGNE